MEQVRGIPVAFSAKCRPARRRFECFPTTPLISQVQNDFTKAVRIGVGSSSAPIALAGRRHRHHNIMLVSSPNGRARSASVGHRRQEAEHHGAYSSLKAVVLCEFGGVIGVCAAFWAATRRRFPKLTP